MDKNTILALVAVIIAIGGYFFPQVSAGLLGGTTNYDTIAVSGFQVGSGCNNGFGSCAGTLMSANNFGTTTLIGAGTAMTVTASTTKEIDFACTATSADQVLAFFAPTTTVAVNGQGWSINYARASTTSGFCTAVVVNASGVTAQIPQGLASTTGWRSQH